MHASVRTDSVRTAMHDKPISDEAITMMLVELGPKQSGQAMREEPDIDEMLITLYVEGRATKEERAAVNLAMERDPSVRELVTELKKYHGQMTRALWVSSVAGPLRKVAASVVFLAAMAVGFWWAGNERGNKHAVELARQIAELRGEVSKAGQTIEEQAEEINKLKRSVPSKAENVLQASGAGQVVSPQEKQLPDEYITELEYFKTDKLRRTDTVWDITFNSISQDKKQAMVLINFSYIMSNVSDNMPLDYAFKFLFDVDGEFRKIVIRRETKCPQCMERCELLRLRIVRKRTSLVRFAQYRARLCSARTI